MEHLIKRTHYLIYVVIVVNILLFLALYVFQAVQVNNLDQRVSGMATSLDTKIVNLNQKTNDMFGQVSGNLSHLGRALRENSFAIDLVSARLIDLTNEIEEVRREGAEGLESLKSELNFSGIINDALEGVVIVQRGDDVLGAGVIVSSDGFIITADHVIANEDRLKIRMRNSDDLLTPQVVEEDKSVDVAILKVNKEDLTYLEFTELDSLKIGDKVFALGSPEGLEFSATEGIVSGIRKFKDLDVKSAGSFGRNTELIQTDAAITHGNSGGPLINRRGEIVGINSFSLGRTVSGSSVFLDSEGVNFAVAVSEVKRIYESI